VQLTESNIDATQTTFMGLKMGDYDFVADQPKSYAQKSNPFKRQEV